MQESHPPPKKPFPTNQLASPVTKWASPDKVPGAMGENIRSGSESGTTSIS